MFGVSARYTDVSRLVRAAVDHDAGVHDRDAVSGHHHTLERTVGTRDVVVYRSDIDVPKEPARRRSEQQDATRMYPTMRPVGAAHVDRAARDVLIASRRAWHAMWIDLPP